MLAVICVSLNFVCSGHNDKIYKMQNFLTLITFGLWEQIVLEEILELEKYYVQFLRYSATNPVQGCNFLYIPLLSNMAMPQLLHRIMSQFTVILSW